MAAGVSISVYCALGIICICCLFAGAPGELGSQVKANRHLLSLMPGNAAGYYVPYSHAEIDLQSQLDLKFSVHGGSLPIRHRRDALAGNSSVLPTDNTSDSTITSTVSTMSSTSTTDAVGTVSGSAPSSTTTTISPPSSSSAEMTTMGFEIKTDNHNYYESYILHDDMAEDLWVPLMDEEKKTHQTLSDNHRVAASIKLKFVFPFYGHEVTKITIATGGFLYMSDFLHQWLTATQYIAPLMANFDTKLGNNSNVHYVDNGTAFIVHWEDVYLQDHQSAGKFNFQVVLHKDGKIVFNYKDVPIKVAAVPNGNHPVKIGLSDAYYMDKPISKTTRRRTIFEYHRVGINSSLITNNTAVVFTPMPTCIAIKDCKKCLTANISFTCKYCPEAQRCSDGLDRYRQQWQNLHCHLTAAGRTDLHVCEATTTVAPTLPRTAPSSTTTSTSKPTSTSVVTSTKTAATKGTPGNKTQVTTAVSPSLTTTTNSTIALTTKPPTTTMITATSTKLNEVSTVSTKSTDRTTHASNPQSDSGSPTSSIVVSTSKIPLKMNKTAFPSKKNAPSSTIVALASSITTTPRAPSTRVMMSKTTKKKTSTSHPLTTKPRTATPHVTKASPKVNRKKSSTKTPQGLMPTKALASADGLLNTLMMDLDCRDFNALDECHKYPHKPYDPSNPAAASVSDGNFDGKEKKKKGSFGVGAVIATLLVAFLVLSLIGFIVYAYKYPQSRAGMWLIEHRPSMLKAKLNQVRFLKRGDGTTEKYEVSMHPDGESVA